MTQGLWALGGALGSIIGGYMGAKIGRRNTLLLNNIFIATGILCQVIFRKNLTMKSAVVQALNFKVWLPDSDIFLWKSNNAIKFYALKTTFFRTFDRLFEIHFRSTYKNLVSSYFRYKCNKNYYIIRSALLILYRS